MKADKASKIFFIIALMFFLILTLIIIWPFFAYILIGVILAAALKPVYNSLLKVIKNSTVCSAIMIILILIVIIIPAFLATTKLVTETQKAYNAFAREEFFTQASVFISEKTGLHINVAEYARNIFSRITDYVINSTPTVIGSIAQIFLGLFVMFFIMYYFFKGGDQLIEDLKELIPLKKVYKLKLFNETESVMNGVIYGQILTAIIQGGLGGLVLFVFGVPNSLFWGFIMIIVAFLPVVGTPLVFVPAAIYMLAHGHTFSGIMVLVLGVTIVMNIDNIIKPKIISGRSKIHPVIALLGVIGGLAVFGFVGIVLGPIIIALFIVLLRFYQQDFKHEIVED